MIRKSLSRAFAKALGLALCLSIGGVAYGTVTYTFTIDPVTGAKTGGSGFSGKGDIQTAFGLSDAVLQANAKGVVFHYKENVKFLVDCTYTTATETVSKKYVSHTYTNLVDGGPVTYTYYTTTKVKGVPTTTTSTLTADPGATKACELAGLKTSNPGAGTSVTPTIKPLDPVYTDIGSFLTTNNSVLTSIVAYDTRKNKNNMVTGFNLGWLGAKEFTGKLPVLGDPCDDKIIGSPTTQRVIASYPYTMVVVTSNVKDSLGNFPTMAVTGNVNVTMDVTTSVSHQGAISNFRDVPNEVTTLIEASVNSVTNNADGSITLGTPFYTIGDSVNPAGNDKALVWTEKHGSVYPIPVPAP